VSDQGKKLAETKPSTEGFAVLSPHHRRRLLLSNYWWNSEEGEKERDRARIRAKKNLPPKRRSATT